MWFEWNGMGLIVGWSGELGDEMDYIPVTRWLNAMPIDKCGGTDLRLHLLPHLHTLYAAVVQSNCFMT